jgi:hypothetical protein
MKKLIITLVFKKNANFFAENWEKSQKIVIISSTAGQSLRRFSCKLENVAPLFGVYKEEEKLSLFLL